MTHNYRSGSFVPAFVAAISEARQNGNGEQFTNEKIEFILWSRRRLQMRSPLVFYWQIVIIGQTVKVYICPQRVQLEQQPESSFAFIWIGIRNVISFPEKLLLMLNKCPVLAVVMWNQTHRNDVDDMFKQS